MTPSETANLDREFVKGFVTEIGGLGSHTAIVAEALEIPAVVGTGSFLTELSGGDRVIIDGDAGVVILNPDEQTLVRSTADRSSSSRRSSRVSKASETFRPKRPTAFASSCSGISNSPTKSTIAWNAVPTG